MIDRKIGRPPRCIHVFTTNATLSHAFSTSFERLDHITFCTPFIPVLSSYHLISDHPKPRGHKIPIFRNKYLLAFFVVQQTTGLGVKYGLWALCRTLSFLHPVITEISSNFPRSCRALTSQSACSKTPLIWSHPLRPWSLCFPLSPPSILPLRSRKARTHGGRIIVWWS